MMSEIELCAAMAYERSREQLVQREDEDLEPVRAESEEVEVEKV